MAVELLHLALNLRTDLHHALGLALAALGQAEDVRYPLVDLLRHLALLFCGRGDLRVQGIDATAPTMVSSASLA